MTRCECCWKETKEIYEYGGTSMCKECYERTVPSMVDIWKTVLEGNEDLWRGTYMLDDGRRLRCHECWQFDPSEWDDDVVGSVYYEIDGETEDEDGGEFGFSSDTTFEDFEDFVCDMGQGEIVSKISDSDEPE